MHDCPDCGQACDCDGEDTYFGWDSEQAMDCMCDCDPDGNNDKSFGEDDE